MVEDSVLLNCWDKSIGMVEVGGWSTWSIMDGFSEAVLVLELWLVDLGVVVMSTGLVWVNMEAAVCSSDHETDREVADCSIGVVGMEREAVDYSNEDIDCFCVGSSWEAVKF